MRTPLYVKTLLWFFLNVSLLAALVLVPIHAQYRWGFDWLLGGGTIERIRSLSDLIMGDLSQTAREEWTGKLENYSRAYHLRLYLFQNDGQQLAGDPVTLPPEVLRRLSEEPGRRSSFSSPMQPPRKKGSEGPSSTNAPRSSSFERFSPSFQRGDGEAVPRLTTSSLGPPISLIRSASPMGFWICVRIHYIESERSRPIYMSLLGRSDSLSAGGLVFDVQHLMITFIGMVVLSALLWFPFVRSITRSISEMTHATNQIAQGKFEARVHDRRRDELGDLGTAVNGMADRLSGYVQGQKRFLGGVAHELCSPLAKLRTALGILDEKVDESHKSFVRVASDKTEYMANLVNELLSFSKASLGASTIQLQTVSLREAVTKACEREAIEMTKIITDIDSALQVAAEPELLTRSLSNLLRNAIRHAGKAGPINVTASRQDHEAVICVSDCGPGVPEEELAHLFDPFYRVDASRARTTGGVGLGLTIVKACIESCGGSVACANRKPSGFEVTIRLKTPPVPGSAA
jgi:two-component system, OmpR family, sensor histidine kinase CpxA